LELPLPARRQAGFSLTELLVALLVAIILLAVALPIFLRAYHAYQLTNAARQMADILRLTRYEAIRLNKQVNCVIQPYAGDPSMTSASMTDANGNALTGVGATTILLGNSGNLVDPGAVPATSALLTNSKIGSMPTQTWPTVTAVDFDARGVVKPTVNVNTYVNVFYLASAAAPEAGYRAVLLMPAGSIQIWSGDPSGNWQQQR
jgi:Tfp pilus assembly protein FimT